MEPTLKILSDEHQNILKVLDALLKECDSLQSGNKIDKAFFKKATEFIRGYADKLHHAKEEDILFVELCMDGVQMRCNPIQQMLHEHDLGRDFVEKLEKGIEENNKNKIIENARGYAHLLQSHIFKEDSVLYPMAYEALSQDVKDEMLKEFKQVEKKLDKEKKVHLLFLEELKKRK